METFESFAKQNCGPFAGVTAEGEQPLECMEVYKQFQALYEGKLEEFLQEHGVSPGDFAMECEGALGDSDSSNAAFVQILMSMAEYSAAFPTHPSTYCIMCALFLNTRAPMQDTFCR
eukprot:COSAG01_NODE_762_length_13792_cov_19.126707_16_plen_117_part_00